MKFTLLRLVLLCGLMPILTTAIAAAAPASLTPPSSPVPRINGPGIFGVRPGSPFLYTIPATGERPMNFSADNLPSGLSLDSSTGRITGSLGKPGRHEVLLHATNARGSATKRFTIVAGDRISLTPAMGWNSWNCWAGAVDQDKVLRSARVLVSSGLINHGWTYVNIDDTWQGRRSGPDLAIQPNEKFPDMRKLCDELHAMGLKAGIYSTPWVTSYAKHVGGSSDRPDGAWEPGMATEKNWRLGKHSFAAADARQWAAWGFDYLKYDWNPNDIAHVREMSEALRATDRDIIYSLSNTAPFGDAAELARWANSWRTTGDIIDRWEKGDEDWQFGASEIAFSLDRWAPHVGPGHWGDPDMLIIGWVGWGNQQHTTRLTPDEQYSHLSMWCLLSAPLLIGCDLEKMDDFTLGLLTNDEVLDIDQDTLGRQAVRVHTTGPVDVYLKELEDGSKAMGFFNRDSAEQKVDFDKLPHHLGWDVRLHVRDLWRQTNLPDIGNTRTDHLKLTIPAHGVVLLRLTPVH